MVRCRVRTVVFDKTGTLTAGKPAVVDCRVWAGSAGIGVAEVAALAAAVEDNSEHPLGAAVVRFARALTAQHAGGDGSAQPPAGGALPACRDVAVTVGQGIAGWVALSSLPSGSRPALAALQAAAPAAAIPAAAAAGSDTGAAEEAASTQPAPPPAEEVWVAVGSRRLMAAEGAVVPPAAEAYLQEMEVSCGEGEEQGKD